MRCLCRLQSTQRTISYCAVLETYPDVSMKNAWHCHIAVAVTESMHVLTTCLLTERECHLCNIASHGGVTSSVDCFLHHNMLLSLELAPSQYLSRKKYFTTFFNKLKM